MKKHNSNPPNQAGGIPRGRPSKDTGNRTPQPMTRERLLEIIETALLITEGFEEEFDFQPRIPTGTTGEVDVEPKCGSQEGNEH